MFIQIKNIGFNVRHIIDIAFLGKSVRITTTEIDTDGSNVTLRYSGSEAEAIRKWWEEHADVHRII